VKADTGLFVKAASRHGRTPSERPAEQKEAPLFKGFAAFLMRGNVIDLAVAVVLGTAFTAVVNSLVKDLLTPLIAAIAGKPNFAYLGFTLRSTHFPVGDFVNTLFDFVLDGIVIYYVVALPIQALAARLRPPTAAPAIKLCPECLSEIPAEARRCKYCTALQPAPAP
jgi:large conductance mechanosensitive channel